MSPKGTPVTDALFALMLESLGIVIVVVIAGINDKIANLILVFIIGLWILFLVENYQLVSNTATKIANIEGGAKRV